MSFLLDTCVLSELLKIKPDRNVIEWISSIDEDRLFISVITIGEIQKGISRLPHSKKRKQLEHWIEFDLRERFRNRILPIVENVALLWGKVIGESERKGKRIPVIDALIAATALKNNLTVVTHDTKDIIATGVNFYNPWINKS